MKINLLLFSVLLPMSAAQADLSYTQVTSSPFGAMMGAGKGGVTTKVYAKGNSNRTEAQMFGRKMISITRGASNVIQIDPTSRTYTVSNAGAAGIAKSLMPGGKTKMPKMNISVSTKKLGAQMVRGVKAPHFRVDMNMRMTTPRGPQNMKMGMDIWSSNVPYPASNQTRSDALKNLPDNFKTMFGGGANIQGDVKGMSAAYKTVPLRMKMTMNGQPISTTETTAISSRALPASLFAVPKGYRKVSGAQFGQMQQAAMRQSMAAMMKKMPRR